MKKKWICTLAIAIVVILGCTSMLAASASEENSAIPAIDVSSLDIGEAAAKEIALEHAGLTEAEVTLVSSKLDYDDGRTLYEIEFFAGNLEYDYEIDAHTGEIISFDYEIDSIDTQSVQSGDGTFISLDEAKAIALVRAALTDEQVTYTEASFEYDDGVAVYQIEFVAGNMEYEFEINAISGVIMEYGAESIYD